LQPCLLKIYSHMVTFWGNYEGISQCSVPEAAVSLSRKQHQVLSCIANQMTTEDILEKLKISLKTFYCHKHNIMMILNLKRINELVRHQHIDYLV
ncbi:helix-turn-helix transcriptional regulator, partial [Escherichia coli]|nr:helix-turn-helix transcriptional regulator [Escherichia coli]